MNEKHILDVTCGDRSIWFTKNHPLAIYCDKRKCEYEGTWTTTSGKMSTRHIVVNPDVICDFTALPFDDNSFELVVWDPPHMKHAGTGWYAKKYTQLPEDWQHMIREGFKECMRVLKPFGTLVFKWAETSIKTREIISAMGQEPLFGHKSGTKLGTHWLCFMKEPK